MELLVSLKPVEGSELYGYTVETTRGTQKIMGATCALVGTTRTGPTIRDGLLEALRGERHLSILDKGPVDIATDKIDPIYSLGTVGKMGQGLLLETHLGPLYILQHD